MGNLVTVRWDDDSGITDFPERFRNAAINTGGKFSGRITFDWLGMGGNFYSCPDTPGNRASLGLAQKDSGVIPEEFRAVCVKCDRGFDVRENFETPCRKCRRSSSQPPAREAVALETLAGAEIRIFRDAITKPASRSTGGPGLAVFTNSDVFPFNVKDTPRNRSALAAAGIEVRD